MISARLSGERKAAALIRVRDAADALRSVARVRVRNAAGALKVAWQAMTAGLSRLAVDGFGDSTGAITITTQGVAAAPSGGVGPYSYAWAQTGGDTATILAPTGATTAFSFAGVNPGSSASGTFVCTITDANGSTAQTDAVTATATNVNTA